MKFEIFALMDFTPGNLALTTESVAIMLWKFSFQHKALFLNVLLPQPWERLQYCKHTHTPQPITFNFVLCSFNQNSAGILPYLPPALLEGTENQKAIFS